MNNIFPLKGVITQEMLKNVDVWDASNCVGARALRQATNHLMPYKVSWGTRTGTLQIDGEYIRVGTEEDINMMNVTEPQEVTFIEKSRGSSFEAMLDAVDVELANAQDYTP